MSNPAGSVCLRDETVQLVLESPDFEMPVYSLRSSSKLFYVVEFMFECCILGES